MNLSYHSSYTHIKHEEDQLSSEVCNKIKTTIINKLERQLTKEEFRVFKIFTGQREKTYMHGVNVHMGDSKQGMYHILVRHFRDNGEKNGGRVEYIDIIMIPKILETVTPILQADGSMCIRLKMERFLY